MAKNIELVSSAVNAYDETPYDSYPFAMTHPYHLMTLAALFGLKAPAPENARVLELGCAGGGNIIPHAINYPGASFVGVDLSKVQIDHANTYKADLGLKNIEFHHCSITDVDQSFGKFDYILCHGVMSWVPESVRQKILEISSKNLNDNGVAYISYNTSPGWNTLRTLRDMMLYHSSMFTDVREKISQSRLVLEFVKDSLVGSNSVYAQMFENEVTALAKQSDYYLRHEHLEDENKPYYFHEFINQASQHGLQYLSDCSISTMYLGNMPPKVVEKLQAVNDIIRTEQYMDFINNRRFRSTLLCHLAVNLNRAICNEDILKFNLVFNLVPEKPLSEATLSDPAESSKFFHNNNRESHLSSSSPVLKAILYTFSENISRPLSFDQLASLANKKLGNKQLAEIKSEFLSNAMKLVLQGYIEITLQHHQPVAVDMKKPQATKLSLYQTAKTNHAWVTNLQHKVVGVNLFEKLALSYMNGKNDKAKILELIVERIKQDKLVLSQEGQKIDDISNIHQQLVTDLDLTVSKFASNALLSS